MDDRLRALLSDVSFPCGRAELLRHAAAGGADDDVLGHLAALPEHRYPGLDDVIREVPRAPGVR